jgi:hypothetical protein
MSSTTSALATSPASGRGRTIERSIEIDASPAAVWAVLTDTTAYAEWNPFMSKLEGDLTAGAKLEVRIAPPGARPMSFTPTVLAAAPERELRWIGHFIVPGLIDGEHSLLLEPLSGGRTRFTQAERFTGLLVRPLQSMLGKTQLGFEQMNAALKARAEAAGV